jgi:hypothetical protein
VEIIRPVWVIRVQNGQIAEALKMGIKHTDRFSHILFVYERSNFCLRMPKQKLNGPTAPVTTSADNSHPYLVHSLLLDVVIQSTAFGE